jgi:hypothetical protein
MDHRTGVVNTSIHLSKLWKSPVEIWLAFQ